MADYMAGKKPQGRIQEASQSVGSIATINKEALIGLMKASENGGYLLSHNIPQCSIIGDAVSLPSPLSAPLSAAPAPSPARRRRAQPTPRMAHTAPHSATPPPMRHTRGG